MVGFCLYFENRTNRFSGVTDDSEFSARITGRMELPTADLRKTSGVNLDLGWRRLEVEC